jgi:hypothetical protein
VGVRYRVQPGHSGAGGRDHHCGVECWEADVTWDRIIRTLAAASNLAVAAALVYFTRWITKKGF